MKTFAAALSLALFLPSAHAGMAYDFTSVSSGMAKQTVAGSVRVEGRSSRVDFKTGDGNLFRSGSYVLGAAGGKVLYVVDPSAKSFYELDSDRILGGADTLLQSFGGKFDVANPKVRVSEQGKGGTVAGMPAQKSRIASGFDIQLKVLGQDLKMRMESDSDVWWTRSIGLEYASFLQQSSLKTGIEAVDKLLGAQTAALQGFPLRQVTTTKIVMNGNTMSTTTTSEVSNVRSAKIDPAVFVLPVGYIKVASPIEKMLAR